MRFPRPRTSLLAAAAALAVLGAQRGPGSVVRADPAPDDSVLLELRHDAAALDSLVRTPLARRFLAATADLPSREARTVYFDSTRTHFYSATEYGVLPESARTALKSRPISEQFYFTTRYGTPMAYARPLELLAEAGFTDVARRRLLDFGYGTIGHLRLLASLGGDIVGIEVDPLLRALYSEPGDQGEIAARGGRPGRLTLVTGHFPGDPAVSDAAGGNYDVILSKNTLKRGYVHPERPVDKRLTVDLGVSDSTFVAQVFARLKPGGWFLVYNLCPAPAPPDKPYIPWADGRSPFAESMLRAAGFELVAFDRDDTPAARRMAHALGWDQPPNGMDLEHDLFGTYTLARKPERAR